MAFPYKNRENIRRLNIKLFLADMSRIEFRVEKTLDLKRIVSIYLAEREQLL